MANDVVILGFGPAAASAVEALRSQGCDANVDIITAGPVSYTHLTLPTKA